MNKNSASWRLCVNFRTCFCSLKGKNWAEIALCKNTYEDGAFFHFLMPFKVTLLEKVIYLFFNNFNNVLPNIIIYNVKWRTHTRTQKEIHFYILLTVYGYEKKNECNYLILTLFIMIFNLLCSIYYWPIRSNRGKYCFLCGIILMRR